MSDMRRPSDNDIETSPLSTSSATAAAATKRKRSRAGCYTCRRRKKACDSARPVCGSCTRLGIPCVFPKLYRNAKGELVPSPQPNGRSKKLSKASESPEIECSGMPGESATASSNPWDTAALSKSVPATWSQAHSQPSVSSPYRQDTVDGMDQGDSLSDTALDQFLASLGATSEGEPGWVWPLFTDSALELQLGPMGANSSNGGSGDAAGGVARPGSSSAASASMTTSPYNTSLPAHGHGNSGGGGGSSSSNVHGSGSNNLFMSNKMVTAAAVLEHLPTLYDYWVNSFAHVLSVLGPGHNPQVNGMLPVVQRSPLVMCALIAWAATHRANIGHPYDEVARLATETTEMQIDQFDIEREFTPDEREEYMWTLLILGGLDIVRGDAASWVRHLPSTRRLLCRAIESVDFKTSAVWQALAYNCAYHDVCSQLTTTTSPEFPMDVYLDILSDGELEMDSYMAATRRIFAFLCEIAIVAGQVSETMSQPWSEARDRAMGQHISKADEILNRLRACDVPPSLFAYPLPIGTDRSLLITAFQTFQLAAELYLRQAVLRTGAADVVSRQLATRIMAYMRLMLGTPNESQMMFPLFLAGVVTHHEAGRAEVMGIFNKFAQRVQVRNVFSVVNLLVAVWKEDPDGDRFVDWRKLAEDHVALSFA